MKIAACLFALLTIAGAARADAPAGLAGLTGLVGDAGCLFAAPVLGANETVTWRGDCKDGYADGAGVLERARPGLLLRSVVARYEATMRQGRFDGEATIAYENGDTYKGQVSNGMREGKGYTAYANGDQYEGDYRRDRRSGKGTMLRHDQSEYTGDWRNGKPEGVGTMVYALGGRYEGAWQGGVFSGKGVLTYAGSGHRLSADFENGRVRGTPPPTKLEETRYAMRGVDMAVGSNIAPKTVIGFVPFEKAYGELTAEQQAAVKMPYLALEEGDEPPYPLHGLAPIYDLFKQAQDKVQTDGNLHLNVLVGKDGKVVSVTTIAAPTPELGKFAALVVAKEHYKPAVCRGSPCEMVFPFNLQFTMRRR